MFLIYVINYFILKECFLVVGAEEGAPVPDLAHTVRLAPVFTRVAKCKKIGTYNFNKNQPYLSPKK